MSGNESNKFFFSSDAPSNFTSNKDVKKRVPGSNNNSNRAQNESGSGKIFDFFDNSKCLSSNNQANSGNTLNKLHQPQIIKRSPPKPKN